MSDVASLYNCKRLYELSGWDDTWFFYNTASGQLMDNGNLPRMEFQTPAYTAGYLLRQLPAQFGKRGSNSAECLRLAKDKEKYLAGYIGVDLVWGFPCEADTPEDALCLLAIKLFDEGFLTRGAS